MRPLQFIHHGLKSLFSLPSHSVGTHHFREQDRVTISIQGPRGTELGGVWPDTAPTQNYSIIVSLKAHLGSAFSAALSPAER